MNCPNCGYKIVGHRRSCVKCGRDLRAYESLKRLSNKLYNEGLAEAKVRNLSGACDKLKRSLEYNKENIEARNLLGLVYYELGETVAAIVEWVISLNIVKTDNPADNLLKQLQGNANEFRDVKSAIKKYNLALEMARKGNDDLAIMQLKKVVDLNDHFVKALLLLAVLQMKHEEYQSARKNLKRVLKVDVANLDARRYMNELRAIAAERGKSGQPSSSTAKVDNVTENEGAFGISKGTPYREDRPNFKAFLFFLIGIVLGVLAVVFFATNLIKAKVIAENSEETGRMGTQITELNARVSSLESEKSILESKITDLTGELEYERSVVEEDYRAFLGLCIGFDEIRNKIIERDPETPVSGEERRTVEKFYEKLDRFDTSGIKEDEALLAILDKMKEYLFGFLNPENETGS